MSKPSVLRAALALLICTAPAVQATTVVADSVADFSGVQGQGGWQYGYYSQADLTPGGFTLLPTYDSVDHVWMESGNGLLFWTQLYSIGGHPQGTFTSGGRQPVEQWAVRRWTASTAGTYQVDLQLSKNGLLGATGGGNGVIGHVFANGVEVFQQAVAFNDAVGLSHSLTVTLSAGQSLDFAIDPKSGDDLWDSTRFTATISAVPEPGAAALWAAGLVGVGALVRRRSARA